MNIASIKICDTANGPGLRTSVFVSGCRRHCPGCFNEVAWDFDYGDPFAYEIKNYILDTLKEPNIDGISLLGGEPFAPENQFGCWILATETKKLGKTVWAYTGYLFEELIEGVRPWDYPQELIGAVDVLVDGPFVEKKKDISLKFRGSSNQRIINVSESLKTGKVILMEEWMK